MFRELNELFRRHSRWLGDPPSTPLIRGFGAIGQQLAHVFLANNSAPAVTDSSLRARQIARERGLQVPQLPNFLSQRRLILSCTGSADFPLQWLPLLAHGSVLVSMGSSDLEFTPWKYHTLLTPLPFDDTAEFSPFRYERKPWRYLFQGKLEEGTFFLANGGFPIDFSGELDPIPPTLIQLTRALVLAGALQAVQERRPGLVSLNRPIQIKLLEEFSQLLSVPG